jgi:hypothetical protein
MRSISKTDYWRSRCCWRDILLVRLVQLSIVGKKQESIVAEARSDVHMMDELNIHKECRKQFRSASILQYIVRYPQSLAQPDRAMYLPLHLLLANTSNKEKNGDVGALSDVNLALLMIETYPAALQHQNILGTLPLHIECNRKCRSAIISKCIELYPEALAKADFLGYPPLHRLILNASSVAEDVLAMIEIYPAALQHPNKYGTLPLHSECKTLCRSAIIAKCIELHPEALAKVDADGYLPLHHLLLNKLSVVDDVLMLMEKYPAALQHQKNDGDLLLHVECSNRCRSAIISKCIELYPRALAKVDMQRYLPLHQLLKNKASSIDDALMMIKMYPEALKHPDRYNWLPIHIECSDQCRSAILLKCMELYPEALGLITSGGILPLHFLLGNLSQYHQSMKCR